ncbi:HEC/Ndc80p family-domain-containing protein [Cokeromyces recurvatus]|uniref:HEC/Ndc80p family-domain-containing protein n=1 Tax=Cokeromyces recurvatus TaxID=90255 RepID=UPI00221FD55E|nr:HEC/Ndc80p family-domain-containing protein [Cokeromyces recurvatus]KAI7901608.1 HEC/Ndc80p family-domain-containing protein [Cokeromyces recurvatus]
MSSSTTLGDSENANQRMSIGSPFNVNGKRVPVSTPDSYYPSKKSQRLSFNTERLSLHGDNSVGPQRRMSSSIVDWQLQDQQKIFEGQTPLFNHDLIEQDQNQEQDQQELTGQDQRMMDEEFMSGLQFEATQYTESTLQRNRDRDSLMSLVNDSQSSNPRASLLLRPFRQSELLIKFNTGDKSVPKKFITDPRNIKDGDVQRRYLRAIIEYLKKTRYEGPPPPRNIRSLGSKDFQAIFKHLTRRLLPNYIFNKKFEEEVLVLLRKFNYPMVDTINAKTLMSVGALHSTPTFFGLLHYLVECCKAADLVEEDELPSPEHKAKFDRNGLCKLFHDYTMESYQHHMEGMNDPKISRNNLKTIFERLNMENIKTVEDYSVKNTTLREKINTINSDKSNLNALKVENERYVRDSHKYDVNIAHQKRRAQNYDYRCKRAEAEESVLKQQLAELQRNLEEADSKVKQLNISEKELIKNVKERNRLQKDCATTSAKLEELQKSYNEKLNKLTQLTEQTKADIHEYNSKAKNIPSSNEDITINYDSDETTLNDITQASIDKTLSVLESFDKAAKAEFQDIQDNTRPLRDSLENLKIAVKEKEEEFKMLEKQVNKIIESYETQHTQFLSENEQYNLLIDKHDRDLEEKRSRARESMLEARNRQYDVDKKLSEITQRFEVEKSTIVKKVNQFLSILDVFTRISDEAQQFSGLIMKQYEDMTGALKKM